MARTIAPWLAGLALALAASIAGAQQAPGSSSAPINAMCPVSPDEAVDPAFTVEYQGRTIGFCCRMCRSDFLADPEKYVANLPPLDAAPAAAVESAAATGAASASDAPSDDSARPRPSRRGGESANEGPWPAWVGKSHVVLVHFPIALLIAAALAELLRRGAGGAPSDIGRFCLGLGTLGALAAVATGWIRADVHPGRHPDLLFEHRWLAVGALAGALVAVVLGALARRAGAPKGSRRAYRIVLYLTAAVVAAAGHHGGELAWGEGFLFG